jgi:hypothetical protein
MNVCLGPSHPPVEGAREEDEEEEGRQQRELTFNIGPGGLSGVPKVAYEIIDTLSLSFSFSCSWSSKLFCLLGVMENFRLDYRHGGGGRGRGEERGR